MAHNQASPPSHRAFALLSLEKRDIYIIFLLTVGSGLLALAIPLAVQALVNVVTMGGVVQPLVVVSIMLFMLLALSGGLYVLEYYVVELIQRRIFVRTAISSASDAQSLDASVYDSHNPAELMNRFFDVATVQKTTYQLLTKGLAAALQASIGALVLMFYSFYFALVAVLLVVMSWVIVRVVGRLAVQSAIQESYAKYDVAAWLESIAYNLNIFKFGQGKRMAVQHADVLAGQYLQHRQHHFAILLKQNIIGVLIYAVAGSVMLGIGGWLVMRGQLNLGQFVATELIIFSVLGAFLNFISKLEYFYDLVAALDKLAFIADLPKQRENGQAVQLSAAPKIDCADMQYGQVRQQRMDARMTAGTSLGIVGMASMDRTYLADTLAGLRLPVDGLLRVNDIDIRQLGLASLHEKTAYINHLEVLEGSILYNLTLGAEVDAQRINVVLTQLGLAESLAALPQGLDTTLLPRGWPLSRDELRLLMIARAVLSQPHLIVIDAILDELDSQSLDAAIAVLCAKPATWTLLVITQSERIAKRMDQVYILPEGAD